MVEAGRRIEVLFSMLNFSDPFEIDLGNAPHLVDNGYTVDDALDVLFGDPEFYEDESDGSADWLMVGPVPGGQILVVPIAESHWSGYEKVRPITVLRAPAHIELRYFEEKGKGATT